MSWFLDALEYHIFFFVQFNGETPLHRACDSGNVRIAQLLLQASPSLDVPSGVR